MRRVHIIGRKNSGKTTLIERLVQYLSARGLRIGTIKHTHHHHELDTPGKDSHRHRSAGASVVGIVARNMTAAFIPAGPEDSREHRYRLLEPLFQACDLVLVEGDVRTHMPKVEVWRKATGQPPLVHELADVAALVSDDEVPVSLPRFSPADIEKIARFVLDLVGYGDQ